MLRRSCSSWLSPLLHISATWQFLDNRIDDCPMFLDPWFHLPIITIIAIPKSFLLYLLLSFIISEREWSTERDGSSLFNMTSLWCHLISIKITFSLHQSLNNKRVARNTRKKMNVIQVKSFSTPPSLGPLISLFWTLDDVCKTSVDLSPVCLVALGSHQ